MDLAYLRAHPQHLPTLLTHQRVRETSVRGGSICQARRLTLEDGVSIFVKFLNDPTDELAQTPVPEHFFETEADGLRWLRDAGGAPVPEPIAVLPGLLVLEWVEPGSASPEAAERFGRDLARTHRAGADQFGAPWPGYIGSLSQDNTTGASWPEWFGRRRLVPYLRLAADRGALSASDVVEAERVVNAMDRYGQESEPPARLHGDLWPGNLLWAADGRAWLVDPAAHGGHRETDLAQLALFGGAPYLDRMLAAYDESWPLGPGWRERVPLHQLHLLLVHAALFGGAYRGAVLAAARAARP